MKKLTKVLTLCLALALVLCLAPAAFAENAGTQDDPIAVEYGDFGFYAEVITKTDDLVYFSFTSPVDGYLYINSTGVYEADGSYNMLWDCTTVSLDKGFGDTHTYDMTADIWATYVSPTMVHEGEPVVIGVSALDAEGNPLAAMVCLEGAVAGMSVDAPIQFRGGNPASIMIAPQSTVYLRDDNGGWAWAAGIVVSSSNGDVGESVIYMNDKEITDEDDDGTLEFVPERSTSDMMGAVILGIENKTGMRQPATFTITQTEVAQTECAHAQLSPVQPVAPECHFNGVLAHQICDGCGGLFDMNGEPTNADALVDPADNYLEYVGQTNTCTEDGEIEHYHCEACGKNYEYDWESEAYTELIGQDALLADATGHSMDYAPASGEVPTDTCCDAARLEYYFCSNCSTYFKDEDGNEAYASYLDTFAFGPHDWVLAETVNYEPLPDNVPKAHVKTNLIYKCSCMSCYYIQWQDITKTVETAPTCGELTHHEEEPADCKNPGTKEHWSCASCEKLFSDANGEHEVLAEDLVIDPDPDAHGKLTHFAEVPASVLDGVMEHWYCESCDVYFTDADGKTPVAYLRLIIPGTGGVVNTTDETDNALGADLDVPADKLADVVLPAADKELISNGAGIRVYLEVVDISDKVSPAEQELINASLDGNIAGIILDINLMKKIGSNDPVAIEKTNSPVVISLIVPESFRNADPEMVRVFKILRIHEGKADLLDAAYDAETHELVFETDCFSTYTLVYSDEKNDSTGDPIAIVMALAMISGGAVLVLGKKKF